MILMRNNIQNILYQIKSDKPKITPETMNGAWNFLFYLFIILGLYEYYIFLNDDPSTALQTCWRPTKQASMLPSCAATSIRGDRLWQNTKKIKTAYMFLINA